MVTSVCSDIYIATILLETNRWHREKRPSYRVSAWTDRFAAAGFDGMELWEPHALLSDEAERKHLAASPCRVRIFNSYAQLEQDGVAACERAAEACVRLGAEGMKFNFPKVPEARDASLRYLERWLSVLPAPFRMLCECHPGTIAEEPRAARALLAAVPDERLEVIVHPLRMQAEHPERLDADQLERWFDMLGARVTHTHMQTKDDQRKAQEEAFNVLDRKGFSGTHSLEFTMGTGSGTETIDSLWEEALVDLQVVRALAGRATTTGS